MNQRLLKVALSPHVYGEFFIPKIMFGVVIALLPALGVGVYVFGPHVLTITLAAVLSAVLFEYVIQKFVLKIQPSIRDGSAVVTGILLAFNLPSQIPLWMVFVGSFVAIGVAKMSFGGLGNNPFNPALVARAFLLVSFPVSMTSWPKPFAWRAAVVDGITAATPLNVLKEGIKEGKTVAELTSQLPSTFDLLLGFRGGCIGEISILALLVGLGFLLIRKIITWHIPVTMIATIALFSGILWQVNPEKFADPLFHVLTGGIVLGAVFMATDYATSPMTSKGMIIYAVGIGLLTVVIRNFGAYPEGVSFAILTMNAFVPLVNRYCKPVRFGERR